MKFVSFKYITFSSARSFRCWLSLMVFIVIKTIQRQSSVRSHISVTLHASTERFHKNANINVFPPWWFRSSRLFTRELKQTRRLRQVKRHLKINTCAVVTILWLLSFARILYCWQTMLTMDWQVRRIINNTKWKVYCWVLTLSFGTKNFI